jgi:hypothetical protein
VDGLGGWSVAANRLLISKTNEKEPEATHTVHLLGESASWSDVLEDIVLESLLKEGGHIEALARASA